MLTILGTAFVVVLGLLATYVSRQPGGWRLIGLAGFYFGAVGVIASMVWNMAVGQAREAAYAWIMAAGESVEAAPEVELVVLKTFSGVAVHDAIGAVELPIWCLFLSLLIAAMGSFIASFEADRRRIEQRRLAATQPVPEVAAEGDQREQG